MRVNAIFAAKGVCPRPLVTPFAPASAATDRSLFFFYIAGRFYSDVGNCRTKIAVFLSPRIQFARSFDDALCAAPSGGA